MLNVRVYKNGNHKCMAKRLIQNPPVCISADLRIRWFDRSLYRRNGGFLLGRQNIVCKIYKKYKCGYSTTSIVVFLGVGGLDDSLRTLRPEARNETWFFFFTNRFFFWGGGGEGG
jgi:hypothetical protein